MNGYDYFCDLKLHGREVNVFALIEMCIYAFPVRVGILGYQGTTHG